MVRRYGDLFDRGRLSHLRQSHRVIDSLAGSMDAMMRCSEKRVNNVFETQVKVSVCDVLFYWNTKQLKKPLPLSTRSFQVLKRRTRGKQDQMQSTDITVMREALCMTSRLRDRYTYRRVSLCFSFLQERGVTLISFCSKNRRNSSYHMLCRIRHCGCARLR